MFDINFDGTIEFHEFIDGLERCGINMTMKDYRAVFDTLNYNKEKAIGFNQFCLINIDKSNNVKEMIIKN